ncbi:MAG: hypothetical protein K0R43_341 [Pseudoduganella sp.]|jgi:hypothetical protein|nr:hypothetical protein [Pseudoduganella sp.]
MHHSFQLASALDAANVTRVLELLRTVPGIRGVHAPAGGAHVEIAFDDSLTSIHHLGKVLEENGYAPVAQRSQTCCGGCGGH